MATAAEQLTTRPTAGTWSLDPNHTSVGFVGRHLGLAKVRGQFDKFEAKIVIGESLEASSAEATIEAASIDTGNDFRDKHLKSGDFLDVERFPHLRFVSTRFEELGYGSYRIHGDLTIRDITKPVVLEAEFNGELPDPQSGAPRGGFSAWTEIVRQDFDVNWNMALEVGGMVGKKVRIELEGEALLDS